jgi:hypothetical protein
MFQVEHGAYPAALDGSNCPTGPVDARYCLKPSPGNTFAYSSSSPYQTFSLVATNTNGISYQVTDNSQPTALAPAPLSPVADWLATAQGDHYGNYYDLVGHGWASVTRSTPKTIYDPNSQKIYDVPANYLALNPWSAYQSGGRGSAALIEEARTNYLTNSYGAANTGGAWDGLVQFVTTSSVPTRSITDGVYGTTAQRVEYVGQAGDTGALVDYSRASGIGTFAAGEAASASMYYKSAIAGCSLTILVQARNAAYGLLGTFVQTLTPTASWQRVTATYANLPADTSLVTWRFQATGIDTGDTIDITIDAAQLEKGAFATSYIPTTTTTATRNADVVTVPITGWNAATTTVVAVAGVHPPTSGSSLFSWRTDVGNRYHLYRGSLAQSVATCVSGGVPTSVITNDPPARSGVAAGVWQASGCIFHGCRTPVPADAGHRSTRCRTGRTKRRFVLSE